MTDKTGWINIVSWSETGATEDDLKVLDEQIESAGKRLASLHKLREIISERFAEPMELSPAKPRLKPGPKPNGARCGKRGSYSEGPCNRRAGHTGRCNSSALRVQYSPGEGLVNECCGKLRPEAKHACSRIKGHAGACNCGSVKVQRTDHDLGCRREIGVTLLGGSKSLEELARRTSLDKGMIERLTTGHEWFGVNDDDELVYLTTTGRKACGRVEEDEDD